MLHGNACCTLKLKSSMYALRKFGFTHPNAYPEAAFAEANRLFIGIGAALLL